MSHSSFSHQLFQICHRFALCGRLSQAVLQAAGFVTLSGLTLFACVAPRNLGQTNSLKDTAIVGNLTAQDVADVMSVPEQALAALEKNKPLEGLGKWLRGEIDPQAAGYAFATLNSKARALGLINTTSSRFEYKNKVDVQSQEKNPFDLLGSWDQIKNLPEGSKPLISDEIAASLWTKPNFALSPNLFSALGDRSSKIFKGRDVLGLAGSVPTTTTAYYYSGSFFLNGDKTAKDAVGNTVAAVPQTFKVRLRHYHDAISEDGNPELVKNVNSILGAEKAFGATVQEPALKFWEFKTTVARFRQPGKPYSAVKVEKYRIPLHNVDVPILTSASRFLEARARSESAYTKTGTKKATFIKKLKGDVYTNLVNSAEWNNDIAKLMTTGKIVGKFDVKDQEFSQNFEYRMFIMTFWFNRFIGLGANGSTLDAVMDQSYDWTMAMLDANEKLLKQVKDFFPLYSMEYKRLSFSVNAAPPDSQTKVDVQITLDRDIRIYSPVGTRFKAVGGQYEYYDQVPWLFGPNAVVAEIKFPDGYQDEKADVVASNPVLQQLHQYKKNVWGFKEGLEQENQTAGKNAVVMEGLASLDPIALAVWSLDLTENHQKYAELFRTQFQASFANPKEVLVNFFSKVGLSTAAQICELMIPGVQQSNVDSDPGDASLNCQKPAP